MKTILRNGAKTVLKIGGVYCLAELAYLMGFGVAFGTAIVAYEGGDEAKVNDLISEGSGIQFLRRAIIKASAKEEIRRLSR